MLVSDILLCLGDNRSTETSPEKSSRAYTSVKHTFATSSPIVLCDENVVRRFASIVASQNSLTNARDTDTAYSLARTRRRDYGSGGY